MAVMTHTRLVRISEAARLLGTSESNVKRLIATEELPCVPTPLGRVLKRDDVLKLAEQRQQHKGNGDA